MSTSNRMDIIRGMAAPMIMSSSRRLRAGNNDGGRWASSQLPGINPTGSPAAADIPGLIPDEPIPSTTKRSLLHKEQAYNTAAARLVGDRSMPAGRRLDPIGPAGQAAMEQVGRCHEPAGVPGLISDDPLKRSTQPQLDKGRSFREPAAADRPAGVRRLSPISSIGPKAMEPEEDVDNEYTGIVAPAPLPLTAGRKMQTERPGPDPEDQVQQAAAPPPSLAAEDNGDKRVDEAALSRHQSRVSSVGREDTADEGTDEMLPAPSRTLRRSPCIHRREIVKDEETDELPASSHIMTTSSPSSRTEQASVVIATDEHAPSRLLSPASSFGNVVAEDGEVNEPPEHSRIDCPALYLRRESAAEKEEEADDLALSRHLSPAASSLGREGNKVEEAEADRPAATGGRIQQGHAANSCEITEADEEAEADRPAAPDRIQGHAANSSCEVTEADEEAEADEPAANASPSRTSSFVIYEDDGTDASTSSRATSTGSDEDSEVEEEDEEEEEEEDEPHQRVWAASVARPLWMGINPNGTTPMFRPAVAAPMLFQRAYDRECKRAREKALKAARKMKSNKMVYGDLAAYAGSARAGGAGGEEPTATGCGALTAFKAVFRALKAACSPRKRK
ncbi:hypothetical protein PLESTF_000785400 [Pleodorina starrii]|nr:hypothetical protein PLESTM_001904000 [Pleodorina starrii]GLC69087.1 hypothetical protein PLESTF_000785400 [Pleodorina starrii]